MLCARKHSVRTALLLVQLVLHISIGLKPYLSQPYPRGLVRIMKDYPSLKWSVLCDSTVTYKSLQ